MKFLIFIDCNAVMNQRDDRLYLNNLVQILKLFLNLGKIFGLLGNIASGGALYYKDAVYTASCNGRRIIVAVLVSKFVELKNMFQVLIYIFLFFYFLELSNELHFKRFCTI